MNQEAKQMVMDAYRTFVPKDASLPFSEVLSSDFEGKVAVATVRMFDGAEAVLEVGRGVRWRDLGGAPIMWVASECRWTRDPNPVR